MKALLIDDSQAIRQIERSVLAQLGCAEVAEATHAAEALEQAARFEPDLVLCDASLGDAEGLELVRALRRARPRTRLVMVSSDLEPASVVAAIKAGADGYVVKPFTPDVLSQRISETLKAGPR